jgi:hypothetical protein
VTHVFGLNRHPCLGLLSAGSTQANNGLTAGSITRASTRWRAAQAIERPSHDRIEVVAATALHHVSKARTLVRRGSDLGPSDVSRPEAQCRNQNLVIFEAFGPLSPLGA